MARKKYKNLDEDILRDQNTDFGLEDLESVDELPEDDDIVHDVFDVMGNPFSHLDDDREASEWD